MCGRFEIHSAVELIATIFGVPAGNIQFRVTPNYNVAPTNDIPIIVRNNGRRLISCRWGFVPSWAKDEKTGYRMINARAETVAGKQSFREAFERQRCIVVADGFYEWRKTGKERSPVYVHRRSGEPLGFAGLYSVWTSPEGDEICTGAIIVTDANELVAPIHSRMPAILKQEDYGLWLDPTADTAELKAILKPYPSEDLELYAVTAKVNSPKNNSPENIQPLGK